MGGACSDNMINLCKTWSEGPQEKVTWYLTWIRLKRALKKQVSGLGEALTDLIWLFDGNEISHSIKDGEFLGAMYKY